MKRVFIALDIDDTIRERIARFLEGVRGFAPEARWVRAETLHVTLKFIGEKPADVVEQIKQALASVRVEKMEMNFRGYGFFPAPKAARVFWVGVESGPQLAGLAKSVDDAAKSLGIPQEDHPFSPHLTLARRAGGSGSPSWRKDEDDEPKAAPNQGPNQGPNQSPDQERSQGFRLLQEKLATLPAPEFGTMTAREFFLFESQLLRGGARYAKIARFELD